MAIVRNSIFAPMQDAPTRKAASSLRLAPVKNDVFLNALLETPMATQERRSPLQWVGAMGLHIAIPAALIIVPLYTTGAINLGEHEEIPLVAPAPRHVVHTRARMTYTLQELTAPKAIPKSFPGTR